MRAAVVLYRATRRPLIDAGSQQLLAVGEDGLAAVAYIAVGQEALFALRLEGDPRLILFLQTVSLLGRVFRGVSLG